MSNSPTDGSRPAPCASRRAAREEKLSRGVVVAWLATFCILLAAALLADHRLAAAAAAEPPPLRDVASFVTDFGTSGYMFAYGLASVVLFRGRAIRAPAASDLRRLMVRRCRRALFFVAAIAASGLAAQAVKHAVGRARPTSATGFDPFRFHAFSLDNAFASFPSGHTTSAFAAATVLFMITRRGRFAWYIAAIAIGVSRVLVGAHYPSDVVCGAALGTGVTLSMALPVVTRAVISHWRVGPAGLPSDDLLGLVRSDAPRPLPRRRTRPRRCLVSSPRSDRRG